MSSALEAAVPNTEVSRGSSTPRVRRLVRLPAPIYGGTEQPAERDPRAELRRRVLHVVVALLMLIALSPLMLVVAALVKLTSKGPVIYRQTRVGVDRRRRGPQPPEGRRLVDYGGKLFTIYKFRTMAAAPECTLQVWASPDDARVTRLGRVLRAFRIDELPQLINVIRGDMNLVGPRPEQPKIFLRLSEVIERYPERQRVLPGITGWAQINHHYDYSEEDVRTKLQYDLEYIASRSAYHDLRILLMTIPVIAFQKGAW